MSFLITTEATNVLTLDWVFKKLLPRSLNLISTCKNKNILYILVAVPDVDLLSERVNMLSTTVATYDLSNCLSKVASRKYTDDTNITLAASDMNVLEREMNNELRNLNIWLMANMLSRNIAKTEFMLISTRQKFRLRSSKQIQIQIIGENISQVEKA